MASCAHRPVASYDLPVRVMSYNIRSGNGDLQKTADAIRSLNADIVGLQEVDVHWSPRSAFADQATELGERLHMQVRFAHIYDLPPSATGDSSREFGVALLSKFPIVNWSNRVITRLSTQQANAQPAPMPGFLEATLDVRGTPVRAFVTHLDYRSDPAVRKRQVQDMLGYIGDARAATLLMGDLNAPPSAAELEPLFRNLRDAWPANAGAGFTYPAERAEKRIDAVLISSHFRVLSAIVPPTLASDHLPVVVELGVSVGWKRP